MRCDLPGGGTLWVLCLMVAAFSMPPGTAWAQAESEEVIEAQPLVLDNGAVAGADDSIVVYQAAFFQRFNVTTAQDMVTRIPGADAIRRAAGGQQRGFGTFSEQLLIDGQRVSGKEVTGRSVLQQISADQVERIEIIRGTAPEIGMSSTDPFINIVLKQEIARSSGSWRTGAIRYTEPGSNTKPILQFSYGADAGGLNYLVGFRSKPDMWPWTRIEEFFDPDGARSEQRREVEVGDRTILTLTTNLVYGFDQGGELRLNGFLADTYWDYDETSDHFPADDSGTLSFFQQEQKADHSDITNWELGGDYERPMGSSGRLKLLFVSNSEKTDQQVVLNQIRDTIETLTDQELVRVTDTEHILRGAYQRDLNPRHNIEAGVEGAVNRVDTHAEFFDNVDGELVLIDVVDSDLVIEESRIESFLRHRWKIGERTALESALNVEDSRLEEEGTDTSRTRSFQYVKPEVDFRFDITPMDQLKVNLKRTVSQLDFLDFVASFDAEDRQVDAGNPELVPEQSWALGLTYEHRLANDGGVLNAHGFYSDIEDVIDKISVTDITSAPGNIGDGSSYGVTLGGSLRFGWLGLPDAVFSATYTRQNSRVTDPFTGEERQIGRLPDRRYRVDFRHDLRLGERNVTYGMVLSETGPTYDNDIAHRWISDLDNELQFYVQVQLFGDTIMEFRARNLTENKLHRLRTRFGTPEDPSVVGNIADGVIRRTEVFDQAEALEYRITFSGTF